MRADLQTDRHRAGVGELDRVGDQVGEHLLQAQRITEAAPDEAVLDEQVQADRLVARNALAGQHGLLRDLDQVQLGLVDLQRPGLDLGRVEHVVHQRQQAASGTLRCSSSPRAAGGVLRAVHRGAARQPAAVLDRRRGPELADLTADESGWVHPPLEGAATDRPSTRVRRHPGDQQVQRARRPGPGPHDQKPARQETSARVAWPCRLGCQ